MPGSSVASAKVTFGTESPPRVRVSTEVKPDMEPEPYLMANGWPPLLYVLDFALE